MEWKEKVELLKKLLKDRYGKGELYLDSPVDYDYYQLRWKKGNKVVFLVTGSSCKELVEETINNLK